jgi:folate-binding protein YgfZ
MNRPSYGDVTAEYRALRNAAAVVDATHDLVWVDGPDAASFLQGILSQDVEGMIPGEVARSFLLNPSGKLTALLWLLRGSERVGVFTDRGLGPTVAESLNYYRIRVKADISLDDRTVWALVGPEAPSLLEVGDRWIERDGSLLAPAPLAGLPRVLVAGDLPVSGLPRAGSIAVTSVRVEAGEPVMDVDVDEKTIPQETGLVPVAVSFTKGCYLGQELVARIDSRGHVNRHLRGIVVTRNVLPPEGAEVWLDDRMCGTLTSVSESLGVMAPIALCLLRREVEPDTEVEIRWEGGATPAIARELPLV